MSNVIELKPKGKEPHWEGDGKCMACGYEGKAEGPLGEVFVECPACGCDRLTPKHPMLPEGEVWHCGCGCHYFYILPNRICCGGCAKEQTFD